MALDAGTFAGNFLQAMTAARQRAQEQADAKIEREAKLKLFELQMKREQQQQNQMDQADQARQQLFAQLAPPAAPMTAPNGLPDAQGPVGPGGPAAPTPTLTQLLADPKNALLLLQSGFLKGEDILKQDQSTQQRAMVEKLMGGGAGGGGGGPNGMQLQGVKIGPSGEIMPDFGLPQITSPQTVMTPNGPRLQTFDPRTGKPVADLGTPKPDTVTPDTAGRISGLKQAQQIATDVMGKFITPDGQINRRLVLTSFGRVPGTEGRKVRDDLSIAIDSVLRARTGAGVNKEEMQQVVDQFLPSPLDSDAEIVNKGQRLQQFIGGTLDVVTLPPGVQKRLGAPSGGGKALTYDPKTGTFK